MNQKNQSRKKYLNIIYFVDSNKTKSFSISLKSLKILITGAIVVLLWSGLSLSLIKDAIIKEIDLETELKKSLATILEYESRYDNIYEKAYPNTEDVPLADKEDNQITQSEEEREAFDEDSEHLDDLDQEQEGETLSSAENFLEQQSQDPELNAKFPIKIQDIKLEKVDQKVRLSIAIKNKISPKRVEGYIWATARYLDKESKQAKYIGSPKGMSISSDGKAEQPSKTANWYSIKYYTVKKLGFELPDSISADELDEIRIAISESNGQKNFYNIPIPKEFHSKSAFHFGKYLDKVKQ